MIPLPQRKQGWGGHGRVPGIVGLGPIVPSIVPIVPREISDLSCRNPWTGFFNMRVPWALGHQEQEISKGD